MTDRRSMLATVPRAFAGVCAAVLIMACQPPASATDPHPAPPAARQATRATPAMPVAWEDITTSEFEAYVGQLDFRTEDGKAGVKRRCKLGFNLCVLTTRVAVDIAPEAGARDLNPAALDPKGHVIARLINRGRHGEAKYNLPPNARHAYWLVTAGKSRFVYVDRTGSLKVASTFEFRDCNDGHTSPNTGLEADFKQCPNEIGTTVGDETTDPAWISCLAGCCVAKTAFEGAARN